MLGLTGFVGPFLLVSATRWRMINSQTLTVCQVLRQALLPHYGGHGCQTMALFWSYDRRTVNLWITVGFFLVLRSAVWVQGIWVFCGSFFFFFKQKLVWLCLPLRLSWTQSYPPTAHPNPRQCLIMGILSPSVYHCSVTWFGLSLVCTVHLCVHGRAASDEQPLFVGWVICSWRCCLQLFCSNVTWLGLFSYLDGNYGMTRGQWQTQSTKVECFWNMKEISLYVCRGLNCISFSTRSSTILNFLLQRIQDSWAMVPHSVGYWESEGSQALAKVGKLVCSRRGVRILIILLRYPWASYQTPRSAEQLSRAAC